MAIVHLQAGRPIPDVLPAGVYLQAHDGGWIAVVSREWGKAWKEDPDGMREYDDHREAVEWLLEQVDENGTVKTAYSQTKNDASHKREMYRLHSLLMGMEWGAWVSLDDIRRAATSRHFMEVLRMTDTTLIEAMEVSSAGHIGNESDRRWRVPTPGKRDEADIDGTHVIIWDGVPWHAVGVLEPPYWGYSKGIEGVKARIRRGYALPSNMIKSAAQRRRDRRGCAVLICLSYLHLLVAPTGAGEKERETPPWLRII